MYQIVFREIITFIINITKILILVIKKCITMYLMKVVKKLQNTYDLKFGNIKEYFSRGTYCTYCSVCQQKNKYWQ